MKKIALFAFTLLALASASAQAVQTYGDLRGPVYFGSGNFDAAWQKGTANDIELGLRAKNRQTGALIDGSTGTYHVDPGLCSVGCGSPKAFWNYEFSVDIGSHSFTEGITFRLGVDHDPTAGTSFAWVNPQTYWADNATVSNGFQNSENVKFGDTPGGPFNLSQNGLYTFTLQALDANGGVLDTTSMNVQVGAVPEPETYALLLAGLGIVGFVTKRRRRA